MVLNAQDQQPADKAQPPAAKSAAFNSKAASPEDIQQWIKDLNHDEFTVRQAASSRLLAAGTAARDALLVVADGPEPETRAAARRLVSLIDRTDFNQRLEDFAADTDGKRGVTLPGWEQFSALIGKDQAARDLFVDMQKSDGALIATIVGISSQPPDQLLDDRLARLLSWQTNPNGRNVAPPLGSCATVVFLGTLPESNISERGAAWIDILIQRPPIAEAMTPGASPSAIRKLATAYVLNCPRISENSLRRRLQIIAISNMKEALPLALKVIGREGPYANLSPAVRAEGALIVGQFGGREHVETLEPLLDDVSVCLPIQSAQPGVISSVQVRDVALASMLQLTGQAPADYGYTRVRAAQAPQVLQLQTLAPPSDQVRDNAIAKWKEWRKENKLEAADGAGQKDGSDAEPEPAPEPR